MAEYGMKVIIFGATGMVGQGALRECLLDPDVERVLTVGRSATGQHSDKLREIVHKDFTNFSDIAVELTGYDACFFCLGVTSAGKTEEEYTHVTYDVTMAAAETLAKVNPGMTFLYVSGTGTDSTEHGRSMWARVKGKTENALMRLPLQAYALRPGYIQPLHGIRSKTRLYQAMYNVMAPLYPMWRALIPKYVTTTEQLGQAMLVIAKRGAPKRVLETADINSLH